MSTKSAANPVVQFALLLCTACAQVPATSPAPSPDVVAARQAEADARRIAPNYPVIEAIATGIYEGPALMASYQGETKDGVYEGLGVLTLPDSAIVQAGRFHGGMLNGPGVERDIDGTILHEGTFVDGVLAAWAWPAARVTTKDSAPAASRPVPDQSSACRPCAQAPW